jgi:hypothetical protein
VRLGLVRYQPSSLRTGKVSPEVQTDLAQLAPGRLATLSFPSATSVTVSVSGSGVAPIAGTQLPLSMRVFVEVQWPGVSDPDLQWELANPDLVSGTHSVGQVNGTDVFWRGTLGLPSPRGSRPMRIRMQEPELVPVDAGPRWRHPGRACRDLIGKEPSHRHR